MKETKIQNFNGGTAVANPSLETRQSIAIEKLKAIGVIPTDSSAHLNTNVGSSNYAKHLIQPWAIWQDWDLNGWDADIIKRTLRTKTGTDRIEDYEKIIHICQERIRQLS